MKNKKISIVSAFIIAFFIICNSSYALDDNLKSSALDSILNKTQIIGRLHVDAISRDESQENLKRLKDINIARVRLGVQGEISDNLLYRFENDFAENNSEVKDAYLAYTGFKNSIITIGQSKPTFSLEVLESSNHMSFIQRAVVSDDVVLRRRVGVKASKYGKLWDWRIAGGIFGEALGNEITSDDNKYSYTARASVAPINDSESLLHIALATSFTQRNNNTTSTIGQERLVGAELIARYKILTLQSEYIINNTKYDSRFGNGQETKFPGYYLQASVFLTGEQRKYLKKAAKLGRIKVIKPIDRGGFGAFELAARFSHLDRNDKLIEEGSTNNYTFGVNWYVNDKIRFMLNYLRSETSFYQNKDNEGSDEFSLRAAMYF